MVKIYRVIDTVNNKSYVGRTKRSLFQRLQEHKHKSHNLNISKCVEINGRDSIIIELLEEVEIESCVERETYYISLYGDYNVDKKGHFGVIEMSDNQRKFLSELAKNRKVNYFRGKTHTQEVKDYVSKVNTGRVSTRRKSVKCIELNITFESYTHAWRWLTSKGLTKTTKPQSCTTQIKDSIKRKSFAYGYHWEEV